MGFKVVHTILGLGSIAFGLAAGGIGYRALRARSLTADGHMSHRGGEIENREVSSSR